MNRAVLKYPFSLAFLLLVAGVASGGDAAESSPPPPPAEPDVVPILLAAPAENPAAPRLDPLRLATMRLEGDRYLADRESGAVAALTLDPRLQAATERLLRRSQIKYGAGVILSIPDGRVLALAGRSAVDAGVGAEQLALRPWAPAASVFKIVSAASLVEEAGLTAETRACYHGGMSSLRPDNLVDNPRLDRCASLAYGIGRSQNAILAKLAIQHLSPAQLARTGRALGFGERLGSDLPVEPSQLDVPDGNPLEFARTAAGFWHSTLSPMHGALLAAAIADGGWMVTPHLVDHTHDDGAPSPDQATPSPRQVLSPVTAAQVAEMMAGVTRMGTARAAFHDHRGRPRLPFSAAGKTGTLYGKADRDWVGYSWFVGFAPVENPTVAFAVALGNKPGHLLRASELARELLTEYAAVTAGSVASAAPEGAAGGARWAKRRHSGRAVAAPRRG
jgi:peptidoglycan glycosyltransferase